MIPFLQRLSKAQLYSSVSGNGLYQAILLNMNLPSIAEEGGSSKALLQPEYLGYVGWVRGEIDCVMIFLLLETM